MNAHVQVQRKLSDEATSSLIGKLLERGKLSFQEFKAAQSWRNDYLQYLAAIGAPGYEPSIPMSDLRCEILESRIKGLTEEIKKKCGRRAFHALNAVVVYEEPEELGDFDYSVAAAKRALAYLAGV